MNSKDFYRKLGTIKAMAFDLDGVLTDGSLLLLEDGEMLRKINSKDSYAILRAIEKRYKIAIIAEEASEAVSLRLSNLGIEDIHFEVSQDKLGVFESFLLKHEIDMSKALYMGDDVLDIPAMKRAALAFCPKDAVQDVIEIADYVSPKNGGRACVRDTIEMVLCFL